MLMEGSMVHRMVCDNVVLDNSHERFACPVSPTISRQMDRYTRAATALKQILIVVLIDTNMGKSTVSTFGQSISHSMFFTIYFSNWWRINIDAYGQSGACCRSVKRFILWAMINQNLWSSYIPNSKIKVLISNAIYEHSSQFLSHHK